MIFKFGKYKNWFGVYQLAAMLRYIGFSESTCENVAEKLVDTWVDKFLTWLHSKKKQKVVVKLDKYDVWNADYTMAHMIYPMMVELKQQKHGVPLVANEYVPEHLWTDESDWEASYCPEKWNYVMDEIIWAFERIVKDDVDELATVDGTYNVEKCYELEKRVSNGTILFGTFYRCLWT